MTLSVANKAGTKPDPDGGPVFAEVALFVVVFGDFAPSGAGEEFTVAGTPV